MIYKSFWKSKEMESSGRRSGATMSLRKLGLIIAVFFVAMLTMATITYKHFANKDLNRPGEKPSDFLNVSLEKESKGSQGPGNKRMSILSMDAEHVKRLFDVIFKDIGEAGKAYADIIRLLEEYQRKEVNKKTKAFIQTMLKFLESAPRESSGNIKVLRALANIGAKHFLKK